MRGALVGRNVLFPGPEDPLVVAQAAGSIIHHKLTVERALEGQESWRGRDLNQMAGYFEPATAGVNDPGPWPRRGYRE